MVILPFTKIVAIVGVPVAALLLPTSLSTKAVAMVCKPVKSHLLTSVSMKAAVIRTTLAGVLMKDVIMETSRLKRMHATPLLHVCI